MYASIYTTYTADFIEITFVVPPIQQFKLLSSLFQVNVQWHIKYSQTTNRIFRDFHQQFICFSVNVNCR